MSSLNLVAQLTPRQAEVYEFLKNEILGKGIPPTVREIGDKFGIVSPNGVCCHLKALSKKGLISRAENLSRGITLLDKPQRKTELQFRGTFSPASGSKIKLGEKSVDFLDVLGVGDRFVFQANEDAPLGISKGDYLVCKPQQFYRSGSLVVVTIGGKTTIKRFYESGDNLKFESLDGKGKPVVLKKDDTTVAIEGLVLSMIRKTLA